MARKINNAEFERRRGETQARYERRLSKIYAKATSDAIKIAMGLKRVKPGRIFAFEEYNELKEQAAKAFEAMHDSIVAMITTATRDAWFLSTIKNDELVRAVLSDEALKKEVVQKYFSRNNEALRAFQQRKVAGLNLSERVWKYVDGHKLNIETALDEIIGSGMSATKAATQVKQYLNEPDKRFRRVRDKNGNLKLSTNAKAYNPGQGVYRSSYKNALRMTRTEINSAYHTSDYVRNMQLDFVVGIRVVRSNNPYDCDICGPLAKDYPKTFKFRSWHPNCRCHTIAILMTDEEIEAINDAILAEEQISDKSVNRVDKLPKEFNDWVKDNKPKLLRMKTQPWFITDNNVKL